MEKTEKRAEVKDTFKNMKETHLKTVEDMDKVLSNENLDSDIREMCQSRRKKALEAIKSIEESEAKILAKLQ